MVGADIVIIDPKTSTKKLCDAVGGSYIRLSLVATRDQSVWFATCYWHWWADDALQTLAVRTRTTQANAGRRRSRDNDKSCRIIANEEADIDQALIDTYVLVLLQTHWHNSTPDFRPIWHFASHGRNWLSLLATISLPLERSREYSRNRVILTLIIIWLCL